jgi:predicted ATPase
MSFPAINIVNNHLTVKRVVSDFRQHDGPNHPVNTTSGNDSESNNAMKIIRQSLVNAVVVTGRHERCNDEVDVAQEEEDGDG